MMTCLRAGTVLVVIYKPMGVGRFKWRNRIKSNVLRIQISVLFLIPSKSATCWRWTSAGRTCVSVGFCVFHQFMSTWCDALLDSTLHPFLPPGLPLCVSLLSDGWYSVPVWVMKTHFLSVSGSLSRRVMADSPVRQTGVKRSSTSWIHKDRFMAR